MDYTVQILLLCDLPHAIVASLSCKTDFRAAQGLQRVTAIPYLASHSFNMLLLGWPQATKRRLQIKRHYIS